MPGKGSQEEWRKVGEAPESEVQGTTTSDMAWYGVTALEPQGAGAEVGDRSRPQPQAVHHHCLPQPRWPSCPPGGLCQLENSSLKTEQKQMARGVSMKLFFQNWLGNN